MTEEEWKSNDRELKSEKRLSRKKSNFHKSLIMQNMSEEFIPCNHLLFFFWGMGSVTTWADWRGQEIQMVAFHIFFQKRKDDLVKGAMANGQFIYRHSS